MVLSSFQNILFDVCHIKEFWDKGLKWDSKPRVFFFFSSKMGRREFDFGSCKGSWQGVDLGFEYQKMNV